MKKNILKQGAVGLLVLLTTLWFGAVWVNAQTTNSAAKPATADSGLSAKPLLEEARTAAQKPILSFGLDKYEPLQQPMFGCPRWQYLASIIYVILAGVLTWLIDYLVKSLMRRWAERTETKVDDMVVELLRSPIKVVIFVILLHVGLHVYHWPEWVSAYLSTTLKIAIAWSVTYMCAKSVDVLMFYLKTNYQKDDSAFDAQLFPTFGRGLKIFIIALAILVSAQNLGVNITGILASLSIGGLAVGLAAQDTLANLFGAVAIALDKPFRVGDNVKLQDVEGKVERIGLRSTRMRSSEGHFVTIPNKTMTSAIITNITRRPNIQKAFTFSLPYHSTSEKVRRAVTILEDVYHKHPLVEDVTIGFSEFAEASLIIKVTLHCKDTDGKTITAAMHEMNMSIKQRFDKESIELAFPTRMTLVKQMGG